MKRSKCIILLVSLLAFTSCASTTTVSFLCHQEDLQIFVNDTYIGNGLVQYTAPKGVTTADVECKKDGITVFTRSFYIKGHNRELFDINIPNYNSYSTNKTIRSK